MSEPKRMTKNELMTSSPSPLHSPSSKEISYDQYFEDDLNDLTDDEGLDEIAQEDYFASSIRQKQLELNEITEERNHEIHLDGWSDLLNSILLHEKDYEAGFNLAHDEITTANTVIETTTISQRILIQNFEKRIIEDLEISEELRELLSGMIDSVEYIASLEFQKNISIADIESKSTFCPLLALTEFDESSFAASNIQDPFDLHEERHDLSEDLLRSESQHQKSLEVNESDHLFSFLLIDCLIVCSS
jgi:hypothetical protein